MAGEHDGYRTEGATGVARSGCRVAVPDYETFSTISKKLTLEVAPIG